MKYYKSKNLNSALQFLTLIALISIPLINSDGINDAVSDDDNQKEITRLYSDYNAIFTNVTSNMDKQMIELLGTSLKKLMTHENIKGILNSLSEQVDKDIKKCVQKGLASLVIAKILQGIKAERFGDKIVVYDFGIFGLHVYLAISND